MDKKLSNYITIYQEQLEKRNIQIAYETLVKYVMSLKVRCKKSFTKDYSFGNVSPGYMDYTYFPFFNSFLREMKLRFGIVLNHKNMRFELWLMGQNSEVQIKYWELLKNIIWSKNQTVMPKYSVLEVILVETPNFDDLNALTIEIEREAISISKDILNYIQNILL